MPWRSTRTVSAQSSMALDEVGISGQDQIVGISQGWKLTGAIKTAERKLADGSLRHSGQGLMAWAVSNARVERKGNAIIITKQASGTAKIDPLIVQCYRAHVHEPMVHAGQHICDLGRADPLAQCLVFPRERRKS